MRFDRHDLIYRLRHTLFFSLFFFFVRSVGRSVLCFFRFFCSFGRSIGPLSFCLFSFVRPASRSFVVFVFFVQSVRLSFVFFRFVFRSFGFDRRGSALGKYSRPGLLFLEQSLSAFETLGCVL